MALHLFGKIFARFRIHQVQPVFVDQHGLILHPLLPRFLGHVFIDALAQIARHRRALQAFGFAAEFDAIDRTAHIFPLENVLTDPTILPDPCRWAVQGMPRHRAFRTWRAPAANAPRKQTNTSLTPPWRTLWSGVDSCTA